MIEIRLEESFPHLRHAPIVEAVIEIRARALVPFEESVVRGNLESRLDGYAFLDSQRELQFESKFGPGAIATGAAVLKDLGWKGVRFRSSDEKQIANFHRDGFSFSRLEPYTEWAQFSAEGLRLWEIFNDLAKPAAIHRIGVRFINRIQLPVDDLKISDYIDPAPAGPRAFELPFQGFLHHDILAVPGHPYAINVIRTIQPPNQGKGLGVILDIDVYTVTDGQTDGRKLAASLAEMRWLKNKVFFGSVTEKTKSICG